METMKMAEQAYDAGTNQALYDFLQKEAALASKARSFVNTLLGRGVNETVAEQYKKIMKLPYVTQQVRKYKGQTGPFETYVRQALRHKKFLPDPDDLAGERGPLALARALTSGQKAVQAAQQTALKTRIGIGGTLALPVSGIVAGHTLTKQSAPENKQSIIPAIAGTAVGITPIAQGLHSGALGRSFGKRPRINDIETLRKIVRPGDILLESAPGIPSKWKPLINLTGADPAIGYHSKVVTDVPKDISLPIEYVESGRAGARPIGRQFQEGEDIFIKRFKNTEHVKPFLANLKKRVGAEDVLAKIVGTETAQTAMYDTPASIKAGLGSLLPAPLHKLLTKKAPEEGRAICSSLPGMCSPVDLAPSIPTHHILPQHLETSPALETPGYYKAPRTLKYKLLEKALRASPWLLRGALGAGLGYGAYRGIKALTNND